jgi:hypothetical protein
MLASTAAEAFELQHLWPRLGPAANWSWWPVMRCCRLSSPRAASPWDATGGWSLTGCGGRHDGGWDYRRYSSTWHRAHTGRHRVEPLLLGRLQAPHHRLAPGAHRPHTPPRGRRRACRNNAAQICLPLAYSVITSSFTLAFTAPDELTSRAASLASIPRYARP